MADASPVGILGGSGLYEMPEMEVLEEVTVQTPFGEPSDSYVMGHLSGKEVVFLSRHGRGHRWGATDVNFRANIYGFKSLGVDALISVNACGSMHEDYKPSDVVIPDQFFDNTKGRQDSFFTGVIAVHTDLADPICPVLAGTLYAAGKTRDAEVHRGGTILTMQGPGFSTRAESKTYRSWGVDLIGMTLATEAKLAREAEMCYASLSLVTDYDVWKPTAEDVTIELILENLRRSADTARAMIRDSVAGISGERPCRCRSAMATAVVTSHDLVSEETRRDLRLLLGKYLPPGE
ncbi:MAG: S-methyl-5'-thioadenosine phosphorylase [Actinobacteria bacterium]|nr:S-methyl-5'-thioadenosine phosphorylase [Actinomycetota bacterium]MBU1944518.1 S-methyl-5'-thioadenosine phosphorylase [Actinomycetota bacterium]MBU2689071.1 S-methyl-5'-thioadenosine phosphorylase [Actinomycetota bacterium]